MIDEFNKSKLREAIITENNRSEEKPDFSMRVRLEHSITEHDRRKAMFKALSTGKLKIDPATGRFTR